MAKSKSNFAPPTTPDAKSQLTRRKAEKLVSHSVDVEVISSVLGHKNKHVVAKAKYKIAKLTAANV